MLLVGAEGVGLPLPGETALITAAALAAHGHLWLPGVIAASAVGVAVGGSGGYWIGRTAGQAVITRYGRWVGIGSSELDQTRRFFARHGAAAVILGRFVPVARILTGIVAGITDMPFATFAVVNTIAGILWSTIFGVLGFEFGRNVAQLESRFGQPTFIVIAVVAVLAFAFLKWRQRRSRRAGVVKAPSSH